MHVSLFFFTLQMTWEYAFLGVSDYSHVTCRYYSEKYHKAKWHCASAPQNQIVHCVVLNLLPTFWWKERYRFDGRIVGCFCLMGALTLGKGFFFVTVPAACMALRKRVYSVENRVWSAKCAVYSTKHWNSARKTSFHMHQICTMYAQNVYLTMFHRHLPRNLDVVTCKYCTALASCQLCIHGR